jgi:hypothetical protein
VARGDGSTLTNPLDLILKYKSVVLETPTARRYLAVTSAFHLAVNIPAPFRDYYIMVVIGGDESWVTVKNITMLSSKALALRILAPLIDSMGAKRSLYISMTAVSPIPLLYYNATSVLELVGTSVFSSIAWTPWDVASALYVYYLASDDGRPAFTPLSKHVLEHGRYPGLSHRVLDRSTPWHIPCFSSIINPKARHRHASL